ncbi:hypothetical protein WA026_014671 [Henosepilachna vigintioctopunctata]|uniref:PX domain-containing protein n=1 Tax=Henosepilachna vigintioctopunctata TaxID=420089 RepID=A0AAW1VGT5_9CUCU
MADSTDTDQIVQQVANLNCLANLNGESSLNNNMPERSEEAEQSDSSGDYLSEPLRFSHSETSYRSLEDHFSTNSTDSTSTVIDTESHSNTFFSCNGEIDPNSIQIPIVGYEIMEERARFTVFKLRIENKGTGYCWYVFRRYTDFVRLCNRLKNSHPDVVKHLPRKRWLGNNFDPNFLEERLNGLQNLVNAILSDTELLTRQDIQDFFCLNEPPICSDANEDSRAIIEALEETVSDLKHQLIEKDRIINSLQTCLHKTRTENENLKGIVESTKKTCQQCQKKFENIKMMK